MSPPGPRGTSFWNIEAAIKSNTDGALLTALSITRDAVNKKCPCAYIHAISSFHFLRRNDLN